MSTVSSFISYSNVSSFILQKELHVHPTMSVTPGGGNVQLVELRNTLPRATGDNKYTEQMVPGYTGRLTWCFIT